MGYRLGTYQCYHLGPVGQAPPANGEEEVGLGGARFVDDLEHLGPQRVALHAFAHADDGVRAQMLLQLREGVGVAGQRP